MTESLLVSLKKGKKLKGGADGWVGGGGWGRNDSVLCAERSTREMKRRQRVKKFQVSSALLTESPLVGLPRKILGSVRARSLT